jgi:pyruvate decarboxylase
LLKYSPLLQEISTIIRNGFTPTIVLINNSGYTIERIIHGPTQQYNDISETWDYQNMLQFFGSKNSRSYAAHTYEQLFAVLNHPDFIANKTIQLLEVFMDKFDAPWMLTKQVNIVQERFGRQMREWDQANGRERHVLDTNLYQSKYALHDSASNEFVRRHGQETGEKEQAFEKGYAKQHINGSMKTIVEC